MSFSRAGLARAQAEPGVFVEPFRSGHIVVRFPYVFPWEPPTDGRYRPSDWGMCTCVACGYQAKHLRRWPEDAYYVCDVNGEQLWAWTRAHVVALTHFVESDQRYARAYPGLSFFLVHVPTVFLLAKHRHAVSRRLRQLLEA